MTAHELDFFVIGGGSGGVRAARTAGALGARVGIAEGFRFGGTCVIRGCVPKKLLVQAAHYSEDFEDAAGFGWTVPAATFSWPDMVAAKEREITRLSGIYEKLLTDSGVKIFTGFARFEDPHTLVVNGQRITARHVLIATGGRPLLPEVPGIEHAITSNEAFDLPTLPRRVLVVGGGYIAVEFAGIFNGLGSEVTLAHRGDEILRGFDAGVAEHLHQEMARKGITLCMRTQVQSLSREADGAVRVQFSGDRCGRADFDVVMYATGRTPQTEGLNLAAAGLQPEAGGGVPVDAFCATAVPHIHAVGDVTKGIALTPVALEQGGAVARSLFGPRPTSPKLGHVASAVFSQPPVGTVGLSEQEAVSRHGVVDIYESRFRPLRHTLSGREEKALVKLVVETATQRVLGAHMVGPDAPEIVQGIALAMNLGATKEDFDATLGIHPTSAEEFMTLRTSRMVVSKLPFTRLPRHLIEG
jgi:glutathione reductase (NADPH)